MKKIIPFVLLVFFIIISTGAFCASPEEALKKSFPQIRFESISPSPIKGVYEVYNGKDILYFVPESELIISGNIFSKDNRNMTRESILKRIIPKLNKLPLDKALKIGSGKTTIVEFMDPNCHYCKLSYNYLSKRDDVTAYVFFYPLSQASEKKIRHILCATDPAKMYNEVMQGKFEDASKLNICTDKKTNETLFEHRNIAAQLGIRATPFFYIKGEVVDGFEQAVFDRLLNK